MSSSLLISVVTPVYNGERYLRECIESVLTQSYTNWEYIIVNNASTDHTLAIIEEYARSESRIRIHSNETLLDIISNHNKAFGLISDESRYCKVVSADDCLFPECIAQMVRLAESHPTVGIVGSYQLSGGAEKWQVRTDGLPYHCTVIPGRDICRAHFLTDLSVFGNPTSNLYRSDLVRKSPAFYPNSTAEADVSACFNSLRETDFGFVHQVLSYERVHNVRMTTTSRDLNAYLPSRLGDLNCYGVQYLTPDELQACVKELLKQYYDFLAIAAVNFREKSFWQYHKRRLRELGHPLDLAKLTAAVSMKICDLLLNPKTTVERVLRRARNSSLKLDA
jgi:glycosyltransferase involved in cell wall biosynthesis